MQALVQATLHEDLLYQLAHDIHMLPFEARKDTQTIFSHVLRFKPAHVTQGDPPVISYIVHHRPEIIVQLCRGYNYNQSAMPCGTILREAFKFDVIAAIILFDQSQGDEPAIRLTNVRPGMPQTGEGVFWQFFGWIDRGSFEVSADAFTTFRVRIYMMWELIMFNYDRLTETLFFKETLTRHKSLVTGYLATNFNLFFARFNNTLIQSDSYVTKRQSIKLLGELLLDRANYNVMMAYVESGENLKLCMRLLRDDRKMVQYEGFHVFKVCLRSSSLPPLPSDRWHALTRDATQVFVANPNKSVAVQRILINNRDRLLKFLPKFLEDRTDDDQFTDEKSFLVRQIELLPKEPIEPAQPVYEAARSGVNTAAVA